MTEDNMADKHEATYYHGDDACKCGITHTSVMAAIWCLENIETEDRAARKPPKIKKPSNIVRAID